MHARSAKGASGRGKVSLPSLFVHKSCPFRFPKPTVTLASHLGAKCWLRGGVGGQFARNV